MWQELKFHEKHFHKSDQMYKNHDKDEQQGFKDNSSIQDQILILILDPLALSYIEWEKCWSESLALAGCIAW